MEKLASFQNMLHPNASEGCQRVWRQSRKLLVITLVRRLSYHAGRQNTRCH